MGKSPGKWIKTVIFGKKSSRSNLSQDATVDKKTRTTAKAPSKNFDDDSMVISSPVPPVMHDGREHTHLEKTFSANLTSGAVETVTNAVGSDTAKEDELRRLEQAAITTQAAFRGYLARRAFCSFKVESAQEQSHTELEKVNPSEIEKLEPTFRKVSSHQVESAQEQSYSELEKVKHSLRKISVSNSRPSEKSKIANGKSSNLDASEQGTEPFEATEPEALMVQTLEEDTVIAQDVLQDDHHFVEPPSVETDVKTETETDPPITVEINGKDYNSKENQKTRRRKSFPAKQEHPESVVQNAPTLPSYMAATESAKAKLRAQAAAKAAEDGTENGFIRRHSLPSSIGKLSLQSPRAQKPLQANAKGWTKSNKSQISTRDDKMTGWKR